MQVQADPRPTESGLSTASDMYFEDFAVGDVFTGGHRVVTEEELKTVLHGPFGQAAVLGWLNQSGLSQHATAMLDMNWKYLKGVRPGDAISFRMTITSKSRSVSEKQGVLGRDIEIVNGNDEVIQRGTSKVLVQARGTGSGEDLVPWAYCTVAWGERLAAALEHNETFRKATATWDGAIGLASDQHHVVLRVYCGKVIDVARRVPHGPTFTFTAGDRTWAEMLKADTNEYMVRAMKGQFTVHGNAYEYVRLTKTVMSIIESARTLIKEEN